MFRGHLLDTPGGFRTSPNKSRTILTSRWDKSYQLLLVLPGLRILASRIKLSWVLSFPAKFLTPGITLSLGVFAPVIWNTLGAYRCVRMMG